MCVSILFSFGLLHDRRSFLSFFLSSFPEEEQEEYQAYTSPCIATNRAQTPKSINNMILFIRCF